MGLDHKLVAMKSSPIQKCLIASGNLHKVKEIRQILSGLPLEILSLKDLEQQIPEPVEDGDSFGANALIKSKAYGEVFSGWVLSDDSGIVVPDLGGEPGIYSARYAGENASDEDNRKKLQGKVSELRDSKGLKALNAYFICVLSLSIPNEDSEFFEGKWHGKIVAEDHGENGFGYDPMFFPDGFDRTAAEMEDQEKNNLSHRYLALQKFRSYAEKKLS
jgi:XTP/dITP diphosphohydrolase